MLDPGIIHVWAQKKSDMNFLRCCGWPNQLAYGKSD